MTETIADLYEYYHQERGQARGGCLTAWRIPTAPEISPCRVRPGVLILPGGAYRYTSPREAAPVALRFAARGFVPFVLNYSCAPSAFPTALREAAMAMKYIRQNARDYEVGTDMVAAVGFSAGGHLCGCLGTLYDCPELKDIGPGELLRPDALGLCYPVTLGFGKTHEESLQNISGGSPELRERLSLDACVRPDMPPVFLWHTRDDGSVPCRGSLLLAAAMEAQGVDFACHIYRQGSHGLSTADQEVFPVGSVPDMSREIPGWVEHMIAFFREVGLTQQDGEARA